MRSLSFTEEAASDLDHACQWYAADREGRDRSFMAALEAVLLHMRHSPGSFRAVAGSFRRAVLRHFPYTVLFTFDDRQVIVHAVFHNAQHPDKLSRRMRKP